MGRWPWAGAGCAHGTPWEPRFDRDPDRRGDWETRWTTLRSLHGKCNPMEPLLDTIPNSNIGSTSYPDPPATSFAFLETWTVDDRCLMTPISYQDVNSCGSISWKSCSGIERIYEYTLREEKHDCGRFALRWKIYARRNIDGNLREFSNLNGKSSLEIRVTTSRGRRKHCHGWWTSHRAPGKNLLPVPVSQDRWERSRREAGEKVNHRWKRRFSRSGSGSLVPMGKMVPRLLRLLHTLIYFKRGEGTSFPSAADESLSRISSMGIDARDTVEGLFYLSLNGNRIPTCYFLWEDFFGRWSCRIRERLGDCVWKDPRVPAV